MLINVHFLNPLVNQRLEVIRLNSFYPAVDLILENIHLVRELFMNGTISHPKLSIRRWSMVS